MTGMELPLFCSVPANGIPNLVGLQDEALASLPTVLVCPMKAGLTLTALRVGVNWSGQTLVVCPELARPIRRTGLHLIGRLNGELSREIMDRLQLLLAR